MTSDVDVPPSAPTASPTPSPPLVEEAGERIDVAAIGSAVSATPPAVVPGLSTRLAAATGGVPPTPTTETVGATIPAPRLTPTATPRPAQLSVVSASPLPRPSATPVPVAALPSVSVAIVEPAGQPPTSWQFQPLALTVKLGTTVRWVNTGTVPHNVTADDGRFTSGLLDAKATFSFTPSAAGSLSYSCTFHPWMKGTLTVTP